MSDEPPIKVALAGDSYVGKSSILSQFADHKHTKEYKSTIGIDLRLRTIKHKNQSINMQIWDITGADRFKPILYPYFTNLDAIILVFSFSDYQSLSNLVNWARFLTEHNSVSRDLIFVLVGNKSDLETDKKITTEKINDLIHTLHNDFQLDGQYFKTSVKDENSLLPIFDYIAQSKIKDKSLYTVPLIENTTQDKLVTNNNNQSDEYTETEDKPKVKAWYTCC